MSMQHTIFILPLMKTGLAAAAIFTFRIAWNEYLLASALSDRVAKTVPILIGCNMSAFNVEWGVIMATGMLPAISLDLAAMTLQNSLSGTLIAFLAMQVLLGLFRGSKGGRPRPTRAATIVT